MEMIQVSSSHIDTIGHDGEITMNVLYRSGKLYKFSGISASMFEDIKNSPSVGKAIIACGIRGVPA